MIQINNFWHFSFRPINRRSTLSILPTDLLSRRPGTTTWLLPWRSPSKRLSATSRRRKATKWRSTSPNGRNCSTWRPKFFGREKFAPSSSTRRAKEASRYRTTDVGTVRLEVSEFHFETYNRLWMNNPNYFASRIRGNDLGFSCGRILRRTKTDVEFVVHSGHDEQENRRGDISKNWDWWRMANFVQTPGSFLLSPTIFAIPFSSILYVCLLQFRNSTDTLNRTFARSLGCQKWYLDFYAKNETRKKYPEAYKMDAITKAENESGDEAEGMFMIVPMIFLHQLTCFLSVCNCL